MTRLYKSLSDRILNHLKDKSLKHLAKDDLKEDFYKKKVEELSHLINELEDQYKEDKENRALLEWSRTVSSTKELYCRHYNFAKNITNESLLINKIEHSAALRALIYRILTTAGIGLTIMGIYALAHCLNIPMPLMRLPI